MENQTRPKSWLVESILATLFCCLPFGIAGIVNASKVESRFNAGDYAGAESASAAAKKYTMIAFIIGIVVYVGYILLMVLGVAGSLASLGSGY